MRHSFQVRCSGTRTMNRHRRPPATRAQREALFDLYDGMHALGKESYREFRRRFRPFSVNDPALFGRWCSMDVGIELDGYTHT